MLFRSGGVAHAQVQPKRIKLVQAQFVALVAGAVIGTITSGLVIGRSLTEMVTNEAIFWGMVIFTVLNRFHCDFSFNRAEFGFSNISARL